MPIPRVRCAMVNDISACMPAAESRRTLSVMMPAAQAMFRQTTVKRAEQRQL